jgi:hypothetical protein
MPALQELNPVPFAVTFASTACWNAYGFAAPDYNMFLPNIPGFAAAIFTTVSCYALASTQVCLCWQAQPLGHASTRLVANRSRGLSHSPYRPCMACMPAQGLWLSKAEVLYTACVLLPGACLPQVQNLLLAIMCGSSVIILLLGVMTRFVMAAQQARLMWCVLLQRAFWPSMCCSSVTACAEACTLPKQHVAAQ